MKRTGVRPLDGKVESMKNIPLKKLRPIEVDDDSGEAVVRVFLEGQGSRRSGTPLTECEGAYRGVWC